MECLRTIVFLSVLYLVDVVIKDEYPWIFYQKFGQLCRCDLYPSLQNQYHKLELRLALFVPQTDCYSPQSEHYVECNMLIFYSRFYYQEHFSVV